MSSMRFYKRAMENNKPIKVVFSQIDRARNQYVAYDGAFRVVLPLTEYFGVNENGLEEIWKTPRIGQALGQETELLVKEVDQKASQIVCSKEGIRAALKEKAREDIDKILEKKNGELIEVFGRIIAIIGKGSQSRAILVTENGLKLLLFCKKWNYDYVEDLNDVAKVGDTIKVAIYAKNNTKNDVDYLASRAETLPDPWKDIEENFHKGDIVNCRIVRKWNGGYAGRIEGVDGIMTFVAFPKEDSKLRIVLENSYICSVGGVNAETHTFRLYPFAVCNTKGK